MSEGMKDSLASMGSFVVFIFFIATIVAIADPQKKEVSTSKPAPVMEQVCWEGVLFEKSGVVMTPVRDANKTPLTCPAGTKEFTL